MTRVTGNRSWNCAPTSSKNVGADDRARSSVWSVRTVDYMAAPRKQLMDDSRHWEPVLELRTHVVQECRDLHLELQKVLGKRVCHAKSWNETSLPYMYNTLKSKCFDTSPSDSGRTCRKQGTFMPEEDDLLGSTPRSCFLPSSLSCMRDPAAPWGGKQNI